jgi:hypothetical protein
MSINITVNGRLTKAPALRTTQSGKLVPRRRMRAAAARQCRCAAT